MPGARRRLPPHLVDHVFPRVPVRQWVLAVPKRVRYVLERDPRRAGAVLGIFLRVTEETLREASPGVGGDARPEPGPRPDRASSRARVRARPTGQLVGEGSQAQVGDGGCSAAGRAHSPRPTRLHHARYLSLGAPIPGLRLPTRSADPLRALAHLRRGPFADSPPRPGLAREPLNCLSFVGLPDVTVIMIRDLRASHPHDGRRHDEQGLP